MLCLLFQTTVQQAHHSIVRLLSVIGWVGSAVNDAESLMPSTFTILLKRMCTLANLYVHLPTHKLTHTHTHTRTHKVEDAINILAKMAPRAIAASIWRLVAEVRGGLLTEGWIAKIRLAQSAFVRGSMRVEKRDHVVLAATLSLDACRVGVCVGACMYVCMFVYVYVYVYFVRVYA